MNTWTPPLRPVPESWDEAGWKRFGQQDFIPVVSRPRLTQVSTVKAEPVSWLWENRVPFGALTLLDGHPDTGKSSITLDLAARLSTGRRMPDGSRCDAIGSTLLLSTEDTLAQPVRDRLEVAGADLERVYGLEATDEGDDLSHFLTFPRDCGVLEQAIGVTGARLVVIDPIMGHLSGDVNSNSDQEVRRALNPLVRIATSTGAAIVLVRHLRKPERRQHSAPHWLDGGGSSGGFGIARSGLQAVIDPEDESTRTLYTVKCNWGQRGRPIDYAFLPSKSGVCGRIRWIPR